MERNAAMSDNLGVTMSKLPIKPRQKRCIFCGGAANSGEHVWPKWAHGVLPARPGHVQVTFEGPVTKDILSRTSQRQRQGSVAKVTVPRVCRRCNNGWMSEYEQQAKATLKAMMVGPRLALGTDTQRLLVGYFTLKLMVLDWTNADPVFAQSDRSAFQLDRTIPRGLQLIVAYCPDASMSSYYRSHFMEAYAREKLHPPGDGKNVKTMAIGFGSIFVFALCIKDEAVDISLEPRSGWVQLFPRKLSLIYWPPLLSINRQEAELVASSLGSLRKQKNVWLTYDFNDALHRVRDD
jgi:hypothetical protein